MMMIIIIIVKLRWGEFEVLRIIIRIRKIVDSISTEMINSSELERESISSCQ